MGTNADRDSVRTLHATSSGVGTSNSRDASRGKTSPWTKPPQAISIPGQRPTRASAAPSFNPFAANRFHDTLNKKETGGNHTATQTPFGAPYSTPPRSRKKQKVGKEHVGREAGRQSKYYGNGAEVGHTTYHQRKPIPKDAEVIDISDEDTGQVIPRATTPQGSRSTSKDPIDCIDTSDPDPIRNHDIRDTDGAGPSTRRIPAEDGQATRRLRQKVKQKVPTPPPHEVVNVDELDDDDKDSIETASGFDLERPPVVPQSKPIPNTVKPLHPGYVKQVAKAYEPPTSILHKTVIPKGRIPKKHPKSDSRTDTNGVRQIDFSKPPGPSTKQSIKNAMRPREAPVADGLEPDASTSNGRFVEQHDALSESTTYVSSPRRASKASGSSRQEEIILPLIGWAEGTQMWVSEDEMYPQFWFHYNPDSKLATVTQGSENGVAFDPYPLNLMLRTFVYTGFKRHEGNSMLVALKTMPPGPKTHLMDGPRFHQGSSAMDGLIVLKFLTKHANFQTGAAYDKLIRLWKKIAPSCSVIDKNGASSIWNRLVNSQSFITSEEHDEDAEHALSAKDPKSTHALSSHRENKWAIASAAATGPATRLRSKQTATTLDRLLDNVPRTTPPDADELILVYPPSGPGAINLTRGDIQRLDPGQYLNDNLIEFGLKLWLNDLREKDPAMADQIHLFNSFFYKKIHVQNRKEGYQSVKKWTTKIDLFKKKYIIVPINEHMHWYLAIICNPEFILKEPPPELQVEAPHVQTRKRKREEEQAELQEAATLELDAAQAPEARETSEPPSLQRTVDEVEEGDVEAMLQDEPSPTEADPASHFDAKLDLQLQYPVPMDVDDDVDTAPSSHHESPPPPDTPVSGPSTETELGHDPSRLSVPTSEPGEMDMEVDEDRSASVAASAPEMMSRKVPTIRFYGGSRKGKERAIEKARSTSPTAVNVDVDGLDETQTDELTAEEPEPEPTVKVDPEKTYIFTFDSLGSKHPAAISCLEGYLRMEAVEKLGKDEKKLSKVVGNRAMVPAQPNYCDCGVYLIHFVRTFMEDPERLTNIIMTKGGKTYDSKEREKDWNGDVVASLREHLHDRILTLSKTWKEEKAAKDKEKEKEKEAKGKEKEKEAKENEKEKQDGEIEKEKETEKDVKQAETVSEEPTAPSTRATSIADNSDSDIEFVGEVKRATAKKQARAKASKAAATKTGETKAVRIR